MPPRPMFTIYSLYNGERILKIGSVLTMLSLVSGSLLCNTADVAICVDSAKAAKNTL